MLFGILGFRANLQLERCQLERENQINFYISDYNLKVLAFKDVFFEQKALAGGEEKGVRSFVAERKVSDKTSDDGSESPKKESEVDEYIKETNSDKYGSNENEEYDLEDALISIKNLDYQLDKSLEEDKKNIGELEGDSDTEFILDTSTLISREDLDKIINNIDNLVQCSLEKELDDSTQGIGLVFVVLAEAISQFDLKGDRSMFSSSTWSILFFVMILALGFDSQFGNMEGLISSLLDLSICNQLNRQSLTGES